MSPGSDSDPAVGAADGVAPRTVIAPYMKWRQFCGFAHATPVELSPEARRRQNTEWVSDPGFWLNADVYPVGGDGLVRIMTVPSLVAPDKDRKWTRMSLGCQFGPKVSGNGSRCPVGGVVDTDMSKNCSVAGTYVTVPMYGIWAVRFPPVVVVA